MRLIVSLLGISFLCAQVLADEFDLSLNANALRAEYFHEFDSNVLNLNGGWLYHTDNGNVLHVGLLFSDLATQGPTKVRAGLGGRVVYTNGFTSNQTGFALPLGGFVKVTPQAANRLSIAGSVYYAPNILSVGDMTKYQEYTVRIAYNVVRQADVYIGARYVRGDYKSTTPKDLYDTGMNIGMALRF